MLGGDVELVVSPRMVIVVNNWRCNRRKQLLILCVCKCLTSSSLCFIWIARALWIRRAFPIDTIFSSFANLRSIADDMFSVCSNLFCENGFQTRIQKEMDGSVYWCMVSEYKPRKTKQQTNGHIWQIRSLRRIARTDYGCSANAV